MSSSAVALPLRRLSRVLAPVLAGAALIAGVYAGRATAPEPPPPTTEVIYAAWENGLSSSPIGGDVDVREVSPGPNGGHVILHASDHVELVIVEQKKLPRTIVLHDIAMPRHQGCSCWGGCLSKGPVLLEEGQLLVVIGPHAQRPSVLRAYVSHDAGMTWSGRDVGDLAEDILGDLSYGLHDGTLRWYVRAPGAERFAVNRSGEVRLAEPRRPETARHRPR